jgi:hypothetical protein
MLAKMQRRILPASLLAVGALMNAAVAADNGNLKSGTAPPLPQSRKIRDYTDQALAKIVPGRTTKAEVEAMFGKPWRDTQLDEEDIMPGDPSVGVWEYRGRSAQGAYRVHIQFDKREVTTLIAKIPEKTGRAVARVAKPMAAPGKP